MRAFQPLRSGHSTDPETLFPPSFGGGAAKFARGFPGLSNRKCTGEKRGGGEVAGLSSSVYLDAPRLLFGATDKFDGPSAPFRDAIADLAVR